MPFGRRTFKARRRYGGKKTFKRRPYKTRKVAKRTRADAAKFRRGYMHRFTRYSDVSYLALTNPYTWANESVGGGAPPGPGIAGHSGNKGFVFNLDDVVSYGDFVATYDQYRILSCVVEVTPLLNQNSGTVPTPNATVLRWTYDHDDANTDGMSDSTTPGPTADQWWAQRLPNVHQRNISNNSTIYIPVVPTPMIATADDPTFSTLSAIMTNKKRQWIDVAAPGVPHYGLKMQILQRSNTVSDPTPIVSFRIKYNLEFKGPR